MEIKEISINEIKEYENNPRVNDDAVKGVVESIRRFGFQQPLVVDKDFVIIVGHTRYKAAKFLGLETVPCAVVQMSDEDARAYRILDNKLSEKASWDFALLDQELAQLSDFNFGTFDVDFGFINDAKHDVATPKVLDTSIAQDIKIITCPDCGAKIPV